MAGGGALGELVRTFDWSQTPLGPIEAWPQSLQTVVHMLLTSRFAMWMSWGPDLTFLYNDAYAKMTLGKKHPWALGKPSHKVWEEIWNDIGPRIRRVLETGAGTWDEALLLFLERSGYREETYHTFSYSPLVNESNKVAGHLCVVTEETDRVIGERRLETLRSLGVELSKAITEEEVIDAISRSLSTNTHDLPFSLTMSYLLHPPLLDEVGLHSALSEYVNGFGERSGIEVTLDVRQSIPRLDRELELALFRIVQEALTNVHRHSNSKVATVLLECNDDRVGLEIRDQGKGITPEKLREVQSHGGGVGLRGMQERVRQFSGTMQIFSDSSGTVVRVSMPLRNDAASNGASADKQLETTV